MEGGGERRVEEGDRRWTAEGFSRINLVSDEVKHA